MVSRLAMVGRKAILAISAAALIVQTPLTAKRSQECATVYTDVSWWGDSTSVCGDISFVGWDWNDQISSVRVPEGYVLVLYEHENFGGAVLTIYTDDVDLSQYSGPGGGGTWNDAASSLRFYDIWP
jgi:Beta/Gamma crystallin